MSAEVCPPISSGMNLPSVVPEEEEKAAIAAALSQFTCIDANIYLGGAKGKVHDYHDMVCECSVDSNTDSTAPSCGEDCINRMLNIECNPESCPCGKYCQNQRLQKQQYAKVQLFKTLNKGLGVRALENIPAGALIFEYCGEVLPQTLFKKRVMEHSEKNAEHFYFMSLTRDEIIDGSAKGSLSRFINHSCNPNCETQKWIVNGSLRVGIFTRRAVALGDEFSFDYKFERYGAQAQACYCGEANCRGVIGSLKKTASNDELFMDTGAMGEESDDDETMTLSRRRSRTSLNEDDDFYKGRNVGMEEVEEVPNLVKALAQVRKPTKVQHLLDKLEATDRQACLRRFLNLRGLVMLKWLMFEFKQNTSMIRQIFRILQKLPISTRNTLQGCRIDKLVLEYEDHHDCHLATTAGLILEQWATLKEVYQIPKMEKTKENQETSANSDSANTNPDHLYYNYSYEEYHSTPSFTRSSSYRRDDSDFDSPNNYKRSRLQSLPNEPHRVPSIDARTPTTPTSLPPSTIEPSPHSYLEGISTIQMNAILEKAMQNRIRKQAELQQYEMKENEQEENDEKTPEIKAFRQQVSHLVVKRLSKHKEAVDKDSFKSIARKATHVIMEKEKKENSLPAMTEETERKIHKFLSGYFVKLGLQTSR